MTEQFKNKYYVALDEITSGLHDGALNLIISFNPHWSEDKLTKIAELAVNAIVDSKNIDTLNRIGEDLISMGGSSDHLF